MGIGGAARVTSLLMEHLVEVNHDVILATDNENCEIFYDVPSEVRQVSFRAKRKGLPVYKQLGLIYEAGRIIRKIQPSVIIAVTFAPFFYSYFASIGTNVPIIAYDHTSFTRRMGVFANYVRYHLYKKADSLIVMTRKDSQIINERMPRNSVIYNPLTYSINKEAKHLEKAVLCAGRLDSWDIKGFDRIIKMWKDIRKEFPDWRLVIAGGGNDSAIEYLRTLAQNCGVYNCVDFIGQVSDMASIYEKFPIFALPSRVEGFPMVLLEAMSQGCICVSFEMGGAVKEMTNDSSSYIIPDDEEQTFAQKLCEAMRKYPNYDNEKNEGWSLCSRFSRGTFNSNWDNILKSIIEITKQ